MTNRELLLFLSNQDYFSIKLSQNNNDVTIDDEFFFRIDDEGKIIDVCYNMAGWVNITDGYSAKMWFDKMEEMRRRLNIDD